MKGFSPEDVLHAVAADAEVDGFLVAEMFLPSGVERHAIPAAAPLLRVAVAEQGDVDVAAGRLHLVDTRGMVGDPDILDCSVLAPGCRAGNDEPHVGKMFLRLIYRLAGVFALCDPSRFGADQRPAGELRAIMPSL